MARRKRKDGRLSLLRLLDYRPKEIKEAMMTAVHKMEVKNCGTKLLRKEITTGE